MSEGETSIMIMAWPGRMICYIVVLHLLLFAILAFAWNTKIDTRTSIGRYTQWRKSCAVVVLTAERIDVRMWTDVRVANDGWIV